MKLEDYYYCTKYGCNGERSQMIYNQYHFNHHFYNTIPVKLMSSNSKEVRISTLWQMQVLGEMHGISILSYRDDTNYELYDEMFCSSNMSSEEVESEYLQRDSFDTYFEELAEIAAYYGCEKMELKCLTKALFRKYIGIMHVWEIPTENFHTLYCRLMKAGYERCANWLMKNHYKELNFVLERERDQ